jgi:hypothetical protein
MLQNNCAQLRQFMLFIHVAIFIALKSYFGAGPRLTLLNYGYANIIC